MTSETFPAFCLNERCADVSWFVFFMAEELNTENHK